MRLQVLVKRQRRIRMGARGIAPGRFDGFINLDEGCDPAAIHSPPRPTQSDPHIGKFAMCVHGSFSVALARSSFLEIVGKNRVGNRGQADIVDQPGVRGTAGARGDAHLQLGDFRRKLDFDQAVAECRLQTGGDRLEQAFGGRFPEHRRDTGGVIGSETVVGRGPANAQSRHVGDAVVDAVRDQHIVEIVRTA